MKKLLLTGIVLVVAYLGGLQSGLIDSPQVSAVSGAGQVEVDDELAQAFEDRRSDVQVRGRGEVIKVLADDNDGSRHQRFILRLPSGQTLLVAHDIDLADKVAALKVGDTVEFNGEYVWNAKGGVIHWTHHDPQGIHEAGWIRHKGRTYQ